MNKISEPRSIDRPTDKLSVFTRFGLLVVKNFFDAELCRRIREQVRSTSDLRSGEVHNSENWVVDETVCKTEYAGVSESTELLVKRRLMALKPRLESHFSVELTACESVNFLFYRQGGFYGSHEDGFYVPHQDNNMPADAPEVLKKRRVSIVIFLNQEAEEPHPDCYGGGALVFYGLLKDPRWADWGFPISSETGLLIAFPSHLTHEVEPVTHGVRYTIVSWLLS
ncbi:MAG: 2OG-Fe(II) oxygenase [Cyanobacteriota bacterium]|nr:2OG-Fe(II) oxygenase [Cyanobacteriota bacterium]